MPHPHSRQIRFAAVAFTDLSKIWDWTVEQFGQAAALRYEALIDKAVADIADDPYRPGAKRSDLLPELWFYHLSFSRYRVSGDTVKAPRHFIVYRERPGNVIEIARVLHDSRDPARHLLTSFAEEDEQVVCMAR